MYKQLEIQQYLLYTITQVHNLVKTIIQAYYTSRGNTIPFHMIFFFSFEIVIHQRDLSRCKKLFSSVSVGGDIFPMLQEETEKKIHIPWCYLFRFGQKSGSKSGSCHCCSATWAPTH